MLYVRELAPLRYWDLNVPFVMEPVNQVRLPNPIVIPIFVNASFLIEKCPLCGKRCHHNIPNKPKILLSPE